MVEIRKIRYLKYGRRKKGPGGLLKEEGEEIASS
jgi:hypothetical protein